MKVNSWYDMETQSQRFSGSIEDSELFDRNFLKVLQHELAGQLATQISERALPKLESMFVTDDKET